MRRLVRALLGWGLVLLFLAGPPVPAQIGLPAMAEQKLTANDGTPYEFFGQSVSVSGDTALVGNEYDDDQGPYSGSAYVFVRTGGVWMQQAKLTPSDGAPYSHFGRAVSVSGDTALIGAARSDQGADWGSAYVFVRVGGVWTQQARLTASDGAPDDVFGHSVSLDGDTGVIGAPGDDDHGSYSGSAYVFTRIGTAWTQQAKLTANDGAAQDSFSHRLSVDGDTALISAPYDDDHGSSSGSAYVFTRTGTAWTQQAKLTASDGAPRHGFGGSVGNSVSVQGDIALIGAYADEEHGSYSGSAYVFARAGGVWTQEAKLNASDGAANASFGASVSLSGDTAVIGSPGDDDHGSYSGSAYVFTRAGGIWAEHAKLSARDGAMGDFFGYSAALSGDIAVISAPLDDDMGTDSGSVYVYQLGETSTPPLLAPAPPANLRPGSADPHQATQLNSLTPTLEWDASLGATNYYISVRRMSDNVLIVDSQNVGSSPSWRVPAALLETGVMYRWGVQAGNAGGVSEQAGPVYVHTPERLLLVALGDSVAAGHGFPSARGWPFNDDMAYPGQLAHLLGVEGFNLAVSGACAATPGHGAAAATPKTCAGEKVNWFQSATGDSVLDQLNDAIETVIWWEELNGREPPDLYRPSVVTLTAGANDIQFAGCLEALFSGKTGQVHDDQGEVVDPCAEPTFSSNLGALRANLGTVFSTMQEVFDPNVPIVVTRYYNPFPPAPVSPAEHPCEVWRPTAWAMLGFPAALEPAGVRATMVGIQAAAHARAEEILVRLNQEIDVAVAAARAVGLDVRDANLKPLFEDHDMCRMDRDQSASDTWVFSPSWRAEVGGSSGAWGPLPGACPDTSLDPDPVEFPSIDGEFRINCTPHPTVSGHQAIANAVLDELRG